MYLCEVHFTEGILPGLWAGMFLLQSGPNYLPEPGEQWVNKTSAKKCWQVSITGLSQKWFGCMPGKCNIDTYCDRYKVLYHGGLVRSESGDIMTGILDICWPSYVIIMVADVLVPNKHWAISNHHADLSMTALSYESYCMVIWIIVHGTVIMLRPLHNVW